MVEEFEREFQKEEIYLVIIGPILEELQSSFIQNFFEKMKKCKKTFYHKAVAHKTMIQLFLKSTVVINTSISEGLSNTILGLQLIYFLFYYFIILLFYFIIFFFIFYYFFFLRVHVS